MAVGVELYFSAKACATVSFMPMPPLMAVASCSGVASGLAVVHVSIAARTCATVGAVVVGVVVVVVGGTTGCATRVLKLVVMSAVLMLYLAARACVTSGVSPMPFLMAMANCCGVAPGLSVVHLSMAVVTCATVGGNTVVAGVTGWAIKSL